MLCKVVFNRQNRGRSTDNFLSVVWDYRLLIFCFDDGRVVVFTAKHIAQPRMLNEKICQTSLAPRCRSVDDSCRLGWSFSGELRFEKSARRQSAECRTSRTMIGGRRGCKGSILCIYAEYWNCAPLKLRFHHHMSESALSIPVSRWRAIAYMRALLF